MMCFMPSPWAFYLLNGKKFLQRRGVFMRKAPQALTVCANQFAMIDSMKHLLVHYGPYVSHGI